MNSCRRPGQGRSDAGLSATGYWRSRQVTPESGRKNRAGAGPYVYFSNPAGRGACRIDGFMSMVVTRPVFYVSDGTGITAETIGHSLLTQFPGTRFVTDRIPFVDDVEKANKAAAEIKRAGEAQGLRPIVVNSSIDPELNSILAQSGALMLDVFAPFIVPLERELGRKRHSSVGQAHGMV